MAEALSQLFPDIERDILAALLEHHGSVESVVAALLDDNNPEDEDADAILARNVQEGIDAELAAALQQELNRQQGTVSQGTAAQAASQGATDLDFSAAAAAVAAGTKRLLQRVRQMRAKGRGTHAVRLLDDAVSSSDANEPIQSPFSPLYSPPVPPAPEGTTDYTTPLPTPPPVSPLMTPTSSTRMGPDGEAFSRDRSVSPPNNQYNSRLERARVANANRGMARSTGPPLTTSLSPASPAISSMPAAGPVEVPVGELI